MFDLKSPCKNCPFRKGEGERFRLSLDRLREIKAASAFQCHKTIDYCNFSDADKRAGDHPQQCAGLMAILAREGCENQIMQVAQRFGVDLSGLDPRGEAYDNWNDALKAHHGSEKGGWLK